MVWFAKIYAVARILMIIGIVVTFIDGMETEWLLVTGIVCITILGLMALITVVIFFDDNDLGIVCLGFCVFFLLLPLGIMLLGFEIDGWGLILPLIGGFGVLVWAVFSSLKSLFRRAF